jgi:hypothetical protein
MTGELDLHGVFLPSLALWMVLALGITALLRTALVRLGAYRYVWHQPLFTLALYVLVLGAVHAVAGALAGSPV